MLLKSVRTRLYPVFKKMYPGKKMSMMLDNAPYHHNWGIPSVSSLAKGKVIDEIVKYITPNKSILLPITEITPDHLTYNEANRRIVEEEEGQYLKVPFIVEEFKKGNKNDVPNVDKLKLLFVQWLGKIIRRF